MESKVVHAEGYNSPSGVSDQPVGDEETSRGATNRAIHAYKAYQETHEGRSPAFSVGLEGGIDRKSRGMECFAYMVIFDGNTFGSAKTATFTLPEAIATLVDGGMELGEADDQVFRTINSKQGQGTVGQLTKGAISRTSYYVDAVCLAFIPFLWPELYATTGIASCTDEEKG